MGQWNVNIIKMVISNDFKTNQEGFLHVRVVVGLSPAY